ncbi:MAG: MtnX-like HAD-IB family phosphatase [Ignavibacteriales bacterium]|nr:MtnX-like HAD-IB family phosphatase [Ignavibacteriales bacterium]
MSTYVQMPVTNRFYIFVDFDGTITREDVGANIFIKYGKHPDVYDIEMDIRTHKITAYEGWTKLFAVTPGLSMPQILEYAHTFAIDESFKDLVAFAGENNYPLTILSDGFDNYINLIFNREQITGQTLFANTLVEKEKAVVPEFPYGDEECSDCANCKRNHILEMTPDDVITVYIGNGSSDTCPAQFCDYIFAKDDLLKFCEKNRIPYTPYKSFGDVLVRLRELQQKKRPKKRHQAVLKRNEVYKLG